MSDKQSVLGRITPLAKADINSLLDHAEDPGTMLDQLVRDYTNTIAEAEDAVAQTIGNLRMSEQDRAADAQPLLASQANVVENLKAGLIAMKEKLSDLKTRRNSLVARQKTAEARILVHVAISSVSVVDPTTEISRFEDVVRRAEPHAVGQAEVAGV